MSSVLSPAFRIKIGDTDIQDAYLPPSTIEDLRLNARILLPGMISFHEEHLVRIQGGYKLSEWHELEPSERALEVAIRRLEALVNRHVMEAGK